MNIPRIIRNFSRLNYVVGMLDMQDCIFDHGGGNCYHHSDAVVDLTPLKVRSICIIYPLTFVSICIVN